MSGNLAPSCDRRNAALASAVLARFRQQPWLAALLILLSPALAGVAVPALHRCPVDAPWLAPTAGPHDSAGNHGTSDGVTQPEHHQSSCIGGCATPSVPTPPAAIVAAEVVAAPVILGWPVVEGLALAWHTLQRLPESTAPPPAEELGHDEPRPDDLEGHNSVRLVLLGLVPGSHPALTEGADDPVPANGCWVHPPNLNRGGPPGCDRPSLPDDRGGWRVCQRVDKLGRAARMW